MSSERLPKQANPALRVLAPDGRIPFSKTNIDRFGDFSLREAAVDNPVMPAPTMMTS